MYLVLFRDPVLFVTFWSSGLLMLIIQYRVRAKQPEVALFAGHGCVFSAIMSYGQTNVKTRIWFASTARMCAFHAN